MDEGVLNNLRGGQIICMPIINKLTDTIMQGYPQEKFKAQWVGVVWVEFVTTSVILLPHQRIMNTEGGGGPLC
jgi:hypothetical protein